jgi:large repetitive protein
MYNSTSHGESICCATAPTPTVNLKLWISTFFLLLVAAFASAQSLSSDPGYHHLPTDQVKEKGFFPSFPCPNAPEISEDNWSGENSTGAADFNMSDHFEFFGENPSGCTNTIWTGGYLGSTVNLHTSSQTVLVPEDSGIGLCVEYYSLLVDVENNDSGTDYSYIAVNGTEIFTLEHLSENDTETFLTTCLDISAYAGQEVELTVGNQVDGDNLQGNVVFGCFSFSCGEFTEDNDLCADAFPIACGESAIGNTSNASYDNLEFCGTSNTTNGVWYAFEGEGSLVTVSTCSAVTNYDSKLTVFEGSCDDLICVTGNDDTFCVNSTLHSLVSFIATPGQTYYILVHGFASSTGDFEVSLTCEDACEPEISLTCPEDANLECGADISPEAIGFPSIEANDCVGELEISFFDDQVSNDACPLILARTWIATDGETTELCTQMITINDNDAPVFTFVPEDMTVDCSVASDLEGVLDYLNENVAYPIAEDCSDFEYINDFTFQSEGLDCPVVGVCTKTILAQDICGNSSSVTITITIVDTEGPVLSDFESEVLISCLEEVPAPEELTAIDACSGESSEVEIFTTNNGELTDTCSLSTAFGPGSDWALWLPILANESLVSSANFVFDSNGGSFDQFNDGTAHMYGTLVNDVNPSESYVMDLWFQNKADWTAWSGLGRSYKDDLGCAQPDLYEDWTYYELVDGFSTLTGQDDLAGDILYLNHMPASYYFGFQIGMGANNKNCDYGMSGWFTYNGLVDGQAVNGHGDVNVDAECGPVNEQDCPHNTEFTYFYRAEDACGNATIEAQVIIVNDETGPEFTLFPEDMIVNCEDTPIAIGEVEAVDNCVGEVIILGPEETIIPGECANEYIIERVWAAFDICGNRTDMTQTITVIDDQAPEFVGLPDAEVTAECDNVPEAIEVSATDNCSEEIDVTLTYNEETLEGNCAGYYTIIRTWTATDECGNTAEFVQTINVQDTTGPVFNDYEFYTQVACEDIDDYTLTATDNCGSAEVEIIEEVLNSGGCMGVLYRIYLATDECGNTTQVEQYITITDYTAPILVNVPADATMECSDVSQGEDGLFFGQGDVVGEDNCGLDVEIIYSEEVLEDGDDCPESYIIVRTWVAIDYCENEAMAQQTITVEDTTAPEFVEFPQDLTIECSDELPELVYPTAEDNCDSNVAIELALDSASGDCDGESTIFRIFRAFDNCGNETMMVQTITIEDTTAPEFTFVPDATSVECNTEIPLVLATAEDNCSDATITVEDGDTLQGECPQEYSFIRTFIAIDDCGNVATATQEISIVDTTAPVFDAYEIEVFIPCDAIEENSLTATDNCGAVTITYEDTPVSGGCAGRIVRDILAVDECGNEATAQIIITLTDEVAPEFSAFPLDVTVQCDNVPAPSELVDAEDNCDDEVTIEYLGQDIIPGDCENSYTIVRTWVATDHCNNSTERAQVITVIDTTAPEFEVVADSQTLECDEELPAPFALAYDNCDDNVEITVSPEIIPGQCDNEYTMIRTYTATDNCGNSSTATQTLTIVDTTDPEFTSVPADITYECDEEVALVLAVAEDNCGDATVTSSDEVLEGECANELTIIRTFTATDACGNTATAEQTISIVDTTAPVFADFEIEIEMPCDNITETVVEATDNCSSVEISYDDTPVSGGCAGRIVRDWYAVDACGNESTIQQIITLIDNVAPELSGVPADETIECGNEIPAPAQVSAEDNCDDDLTVDYNEEFVPQDCGYQLIRTWSVTDHCDNTNSASQTITVVDTTAPVIDAEDSEITISCDQEILIIVDTAYDACDEDVDITNTYEVIPGECSNEYSEVFVFTATDDCGNSSDVTIIVHHEDNTAPEFDSVPQDNELSCEEDLPTDMATATDNCGEAIVSFVDEILEGQCPNNYIVVRHWTATDACGNANTAETNYYIYDNTNPTIIGSVSDVEVECADEVPAYPELTATDNCGEATISINEEVLEEDECGNYFSVVTITATDACFNQSSVSYTVSVYDQTAPELTGAPADLVLDCEDEVPAPAEVTALDNCNGALLVDFTEELVGDLPTPGSDADCSLSTPAEYDGEGTTCDNNEPWSVRLFSFPGLEFYSNIEGQFVQFPDGSATLTATVVSNENPNAGWIIDVTFQDRMDWASWSTQGFPTGHKDDCGLGADEYEDWTYYIMTAGSASLEGWGDYDGSFLNLTHAPSNYYYGYQVGTAANNVNDQYGNGGWFTYNGIFNEANVSGSGDFAFDMDCCPQYSIERTWTAEDCTGNSVSHTQTISFADITPGIVGGGFDFAPALPSGKGETASVRVNAYPNPAMDKSTIEFTLVENSYVGVQVYNMSGALVADLFNAPVLAGQSKKVEFDATELPVGIYLYRITTKSEVIMDRIIIQK